MFALCDALARIGPTTPDLDHRPTFGVHPYRGADLAAGTQIVSKNIGHCLESGGAVPLNTASCCMRRHYHPCCRVAGSGLAGYDVRHGSAITPIPLRVKLDGSPKITAIEIRPQAIKKH